MKRVVLALAVLMVAACSARVSLPRPTGTPGPSAIASQGPASAQPSTQASTQPSSALPEGAPFALDSFVEVVAQGLRMRSAPGLGSAALRPSLDDGTVAFVLDGPVSADSYDWYRIHPYPQTGNPDPAPLVGWVAAADPAGQPYLVEKQRQCPADPPVFPELGGLDTNDGLRFGSDLVNLTCLGAREVTFTGRLGAFLHGSCSGLPFRTEPTWLDECKALLFLAHPEQQLERVLVPAFAPGIQGELPDPAELLEAENYRLVEVTGHFDDPAARTCRAVDDPNRDPSFGERDAQLVVLGCRATFVVTALH